MSYKDPANKKDQRFRVNLNAYQADAIEALAALHRKQAASYLADIIEAHLDALNTHQDDNSIKHCA